MPATLPWPKIPNTPAKNRCCRPSRSLCCALRKRTSAWAIVSRLIWCPGSASSRRGPADGDRRTPPRNCRSVRRVGAKSSNSSMAKPVWLVGPPEIGEAARQIVDDARIDRRLDAWRRPACRWREALLPRRRRRDHDVAADQLAPVHVIAKRRGQQARAIAALAKERVGLLEHRHTRPLEMAGVGGDARRVPSRPSASRPAGRP